MGIFSKHNDPWESSQINSVPIKTGYSEVDGCSWVESDSVKDALKLLCEYNRCCSCCGGDGDYETLVQNILLSFPEELWPDMKWPSSFSQSTETVKEHMDKYKEYLNR